MNRLVVAAMMLAASVPAVAGTRLASWSYGARAFPEGEVEIQSWATLVRWYGGVRPDGSPHGRVLSGGLLHFVTVVAFAERWELAALASVVQPPAVADSPRPLSADRLSLQFRHQLTPSRAESPVDVLALVELSAPVSESTPRGYGVRALIALETDLGKWNALVNIGLSGAADSTGREVSWEMSAAAMFPVTASLFFGLEAFGYGPLGAQAVRRRVLYAGPTLTLQRGRFWGALSAAWGADKPARMDLFDPVPVPIEPGPAPALVQVFNGFCARLLLGVNL